MHASAGLSPHLPCCGARPPCASPRPPEGFPGCGWSVGPRTVTAAVGGLLVHSWSSGRLPSRDFLSLEAAGPGLQAEVVSTLKVLDHFQWEKSVLWRQVISPVVIFSVFPHPPPNSKAALTPSHPDILCKASHSLPWGFSAFCEAAGTGSTCRKGWVGCSHFPAKGSRIRAPSRGRRPHAWNRF